MRVGSYIVVLKKKKVKLLSIAFADNTEQGQHGTRGLHPKLNSMFFLEIKGKSLLHNLVRV